MKKSTAARLSIPAVAHGDGDSAFTSTPGSVTALERWLAHKILELTGNPPVCIVLWNGDEIAVANDQPVARLIVRDRGAMYRLILNPNLNFGDLYSVGRLDIDGDLRRFLETVYSGVSGDRGIYGLKRLWKFLHTRPRANTLAGSHNNIHHHYDIGNDFYALWLDREMQYTCAYFPDADLSLEQAQFAKMDHVARKLQLKPGDTVVEAGCGWGGLARHMARYYGVTVRAYNISHEQVAYARGQAKAEGLHDRIEYIEDDYRNIAGKFDVFVSVGMLEHVGTAHYPEFGEVIDRCLAPNGRGLIHSIGRNKPNLINAWIEKRIFPGAYLPTLKEMMTIFEGRKFSVLDVENLRLHYAKTLEHWLARFDQHSDKIERMFDPYFARAWRLYLAGSIAAFGTGALQLFQVGFTRGTNNQVPSSRAYLYR